VPASQIRWSLVIVPSDHAAVSSAPVFLFLFNISLQATPVQRFPALPPEVAPPVLAVTYQSSAPFLFPSQWLDRFHHPPSPNVLDQPLHRGVFFAAFFSRNIINLLRSSVPSTTPTSLPTSSLPSRHRAAVCGHRALQSPFQKTPSSLPLRFRPFGLVLLSNPTVA